ncbi:MAG: glucose-1-phosphate adenylyltransferase [Lachnospirales bacterium]
MAKMEMLAMLLAGGQGSRLGVLTNTKAKPGICFGGRYRIIDFPLSNCVNSGITAVGVLTQYRPLALNKHIGIGVPWDLDRSNGGVTILAPHAKQEKKCWFSGTADAIYQNLEYVDSCNPEYVLILSGDHIYKMDYSKMLKEHKANKADATIAVLEVPIEEAHRFGIMKTVEGTDQIYEFAEKEENPTSNLASMGIYIFTWKKLREELIKGAQLHSDSDFGKHIIPAMLERNLDLYAHRFVGYWKDVGTIESYWSANMELIKTVPEFNLYENFWNIYTNSESQVPQYTGKEASIKASLIADGCKIHGTLVNSIIGPEVTIDEGVTIKDSIIMSNCTIKKNAKINRAIIDEGTTIEENVKIGEFDNIPNKLKPKIYDTGITVIGEYSYVPKDVTIGKNCVIIGKSKAEEYIGGVLGSGETIDNSEEGVF